MPNYGIKSGTNVLTNTDQELAATSKYPSLKYFKWGDSQFTTDGSGIGSVSIDHGLNYAPMFLVLRKLTAQWSSPDLILPTTEYPNSFCHLGGLNWYAGGEENFDLIAKVDTDNLYISDRGMGKLANNTTYHFRYFILVNPIQTFSGPSGITLDKSYGIKISKPGVNVFIAEEYDLAYSSKYKSMQFYPEYVRSETITLPAIQADAGTPRIEQADYIDFEHDFEYPPFFYSYFGNSPLTQLAPVPNFSANRLDTLNNSVAGFCNSDRVRTYYWRCSALDHTGPDTYENLEESTITIQNVTFTENLTGESS